MALSIQLDDTRHVRNGDFAIRVREHQLLVPVELGGVLRRLNVRTVDQLVSTLRSFPTAFMAELNWDERKFEDARSDVFERLRGHVNPKMLEERPRFERGTGALPPRRSR